MTSRYVVLLTVAFATAGCSKTRTDCSVTGQVLWKEKPAIGVYVVLHALPVVEGSSCQGSARTDQNGAFSLRVQEPGEYAVTLFWPKVIVEAGETIEGEDRLSGKYRDPNPPVSRVTVQNGTNVLLPIKLQ